MNVSAFINAQKIVVNPGPVARFMRAAKKRRVDMGVIGDSNMNCIASYQGSYNNPNPDEDRLSCPSGWVASLMNVWGGYFGLYASPVMTMGCKDSGTVINSNSPVIGCAGSNPKSILDCGRSQVSDYAVTGGHSIQAAGDWPEYPGIYLDAAAVSFNSYKVFQGGGDFSAAGFHPGTVNTTSMNTPSSFKTAQLAGNLKHVLTFGKLAVVSSSFKMSYRIEDFKDNTGAKRVAQNDGQYYYVSGQSTEIITVPAYTDTDYDVIPAPATYTDPGGAAPLDVNNQVSTVGCPNVLYDAKATLPCNFNDVTATLPAPLRTGITLADHMMLCSFGGWSGLTTTGTGTTYTNPIAGLYQRLEDVSQLTGVGVSAFAGYSGWLAVDVATSLQSWTQKQAGELFRQMTRLQHCTREKAMVCIVLRIGQNDRDLNCLGRDSSGLTNSLAPAVGTAVGASHSPCWTTDGFYENMAEIIRKLQTWWLAAGYAKDNLVFLLNNGVPAVPNQVYSVSQADAAIESIVNEFPQVTIVNWGSITNAQIVAVHGWASSGGLGTGQGDWHLRMAGNDFVEQFTLNALLAASIGADSSSGGGLSLGMME